MLQPHLQARLRNLKNKKLSLDVLGYHVLKLYIYIYIYKTEISPFLLHKIFSQIINLPTKTNRA